MRTTATKVENEVENEVEAVVEAVAVAAAPDPCSELSGHRHMLVALWPAPLRLELERASTRAGLMVFARRGCRLEPLSGCHVEGRYRYAPLVRAFYGVPLAGPDELRANLGSEAEPDELVLSVHTEGAWLADDWDPAAVALVGECEGATHVLDTIEVGAASLARGRYTEPFGPAEIDEELVRLGDLERCRGEARSRPPRGCERAWSVLLVALDPTVARDGCPGDTGFDGLLCSAPGRTNYCGLVPEDRRCTQRRGEEPRLARLFADGLM